jgi:hypothetical protein
MREATLRDAMTKEQRALIPGRLTERFIADMLIKVRYCDIFIFTVCFLLSSSLCFTLFDYFSLLSSIFRESEKESAPVIYTPEGLAKEYNVPIATVSLCIHDIFHKILSHKFLIISFLLFIFLTIFFHTLLSGQKRDEVRPSTHYSVPRPRRVSAGPIS